MFTKSDFSNFLGLLICRFVGDSFAIKSVGVFGYRKIYIIDIINVFRTIA